MTEETKELGCPFFKFSEVIPLAEKSSGPTLSLAVRSLMKSIQREFEKCGLDKKDFLIVDLGKIHLSIRSNPMELTLKLSNLSHGVTGRRTRSLEMIAKRNPEKSHLLLSVHDDDAEEESRKRGKIHEVFMTIKRFQNMLLPAHVEAFDEPETLSTQVIFSFTSRPALNRSFSKAKR